LLAAFWPFAEDSMSDIAKPLLDADEAAAVLGQLKCR
jgi:hypothetical protein